MISGVEYVRNVCKERKIPVSTLEKDCGFANGYLNPKKVTKIPYERAVVISKYLNVDINNILGIDDVDLPSLTQKDEKEIGRDLDRIMRELETDQDGPLFYNGEPIDDESLKLLRNALELGLKQLKEENKVKYGRKKNK